MEQLTSSQLISGYNAIEDLLDKQMDYPLMLLRMEFLEEYERRTSELIDIILS